MKIILKYHDDDALGVEEAVARAKIMGVKVSSIESYPDSNDPLDHIYFGIQQLITHKQLDLLFDNEALYHEKIQELRSLVLTQVTSELDRAIADNERRVTED